MGLSGFKLLLVVGVVAVLFLPTLVKRSQGLTVAFDQLRARLSGEPLPEPVQIDIPAEAARPRFAERLGGWIGRLIHRRGRASRA